MAYNRFRRREPPRKAIRCSCGGESKLIKRRNFPHGRESRGKSHMAYKCKECNIEILLNKLQEAKK